MIPLKVLVVDDDRDFADSLAEVLEQYGHTVSVAYSGLEAIEIVADQPLHLALVDMRMPGLNGVESFFEMKKMRPDMRFMMMTAYPAEGLLKEALEGGAQGVLPKPFELSDLLAVFEGEAAGEGT